MKKNWITFFELLALVTLLLAPLSLLALDNNLLFPYITSKAFVWRPVVGILFASWLSLALLNSRYRIPLKHPLFLGFSFFMLVMLVANFLGVDPYHSFWSNAERMDGFIGLAYLYAYFLAGFGFLKGEQENNKPSILPSVVWLVLMAIVVGLNYQASFEVLAGDHAFAWLVLSFMIVVASFIPSFDKPHLAKTIFHGLISIGVFLGIMALFQDKARVDSILGNPIYLASYSSFAIFISFYYLTARDYIFNQAYLRPLLYGSLILFFLLIIFETSTRGAVLGLVFGGLTTSLLFAFLLRKRELRWWRYFGIVSSIFIITTIGLFFGFKSEIQKSDLLSSGNIIKRAANFSLEDSTTKHRLANWEQAFDGFEERPLLGWGQENYVPVFSKYYQADELYQAEQWFDRTHNMFLDWLVFGGALGLLAFLLLLVIMLYLIWKKSTPHLSTLEQSILSGVSVAYMAQNFVAFDALATALWLSTIMMFVASLSYRHYNSINTKFDLRESVVIFAIVGLWISLLWWIYISNIEPKKANHEFIQFLRPVVSQTDYDTILAERYLQVEQAVNAGTFLTQEFIEQLLNNRRLYLNDKVSVATKQQYINLIMTTTEELIDEHPANTRLPLFYATFLIDLKEYERAHVYLTKALNQSPDKIQILWIMAQNESRLGNNEQALEHLKHAAEVAPEYEQAQTIYQEALKQVSN